MFYLKHSAVCFKYPAWCFKDPAGCFFCPAGYLAQKHPVGSFISKTPSRAFKNNRPDVYISNTRPGILHTLLEFGHEIIYVRSDGPYIFILYLENVRGFWSTSLQLDTDWQEKVSYSGELLLLLRLWIGAKKSYFRKSYLRGVILEKSKAAPEYVMESQRLVFWWNEGTSESKEPNFRKGKLPPRFQMH